MGARTTELGERQGVEDRTMRAALERWVRRRFGERAHLEAIEGALDVDAGDKGFGYGEPVAVRLVGAPSARVVVHVAKGRGFGHDTLADRGFSALLAYETFGALPRHVRALDVGIVDAAGELRSIGDARDFYFVTEYAAGEPYFHDLDAIAARGALRARDERRLALLVENLSTLHQEKRHDVEAWRRRVRELFGHHECIAGLLDSYANEAGRAVLSAEAALSIERRCVEWRARLLPRAHRLSRVHGDYHPWNLLFSANDELSLLDRSRGSHGDPADDLAALAINYVLYALRTEGALAGPFATMFRSLFTGYLGATGDDELLETIVPQLAWRALVVASPLWFPAYAPVGEARSAATSDGAVRAKLLGWIDRLLDGRALDPQAAIR